MVHSLNLYSYGAPLGMVVMMVAVSRPVPVVACFSSVLDFALPALFRSTLELGALWCLCCMFLFMEMELKMVWSSYS